MGECICDWENGCGGTGVVHCMGCGGDLCVCRACFGHGMVDCGGCDDPACPEWEDAYEREHGPFRIYDDPEGGD